MVTNFDKFQFSVINEFSVINFHCVLKIVLAYQQFCFNLLYRQSTQRIMDIRFNDFYSLDSKGQKILRSVLKLAGSNSISSLTEQSFRRADTEALSTIILSLVDVVDHSLNVLRAAATAMDDLKNEQILNQQTVIKLQEELISKQASSGTVHSNVNREQFVDLSLIHI